MKLPAAAILALGYVGGQGITFITQATIGKYASPDALGLAVLLLSILSFGLQFSEYGNTTFFALRNIVGPAALTHVNLLSRGIIAFLASSVLAVSIPWPTTTSTFVVIISSFAAIFFGCSNISRIENEGDYLYVAKIQVFCWLACSITIASVSFLEPKLQFVGGIVWLLAAISFLFATNEKNVTYELGRYSMIASVRDVGMHIFPPLGGQILGRVILVATQANHGLALVGVFGMAKYIQTAATLGLSFMMRPKHRRVTLDFGLEDRPEYICTYRGVCRKYRIEIFMSIAISVISGVCYFLLKDESPYAIWVLLLIHLPATVLSNIATQHNARTLLSKHFVMVEYLALSANAIAFFLLVSRSLVAAVVVGELAQALVNISRAASKSIDQ